MAARTLKHTWLIVFELAGKRQPRFEAALKAWGAVFWKPGSYLLENSSYSAETLVKKLYALSRAGDNILISEKESGAIYIARNQAGDPPGACY